MDFDRNINTIAQLQSDFAVLVDKMEQLPAPSRDSLASELESLRASLTALVGENVMGYRALEESANVALGKYKTLFEAFPLGISITNNEGQVLETNAEAERLLGVSSRDHTHRKIDSPEWLIIRPDGSPMPPEEYASTRALKEKRRVENVEMGILRSDGEVTWINVSATPIPLEGYGVVITYGDITQRRKSDQALALANNRFETLLDNLPVGVALTDANGKFLVSNPANGALFGGGGITGDAAGPAGGYTLRYPDGELIPPEKLPLVCALKDGTNTRNMEFIIRRESGEEVSILSNCSPVFGENGSIQGAVAAMQDITRLKEVELQQRLLEFREQERLEIARDLHDGPIQDLISVLFNIQFAKEAIQEGAVKLEFEQVGLGVQSVIRELREVCNTLRPPSLIRFGVGRAILVHAEEFTERHPEIDLQLNLYNDANLLPQQTCLALYRIYQEAINNILRHANASRVEVALTGEGDQIVLRIADNGIGFMVPHDLTGQTRSGHFGLAGMKERAEIIGGQLQITSAPGEGTQVRVAVARKNMKANG